MSNFYHLIKESSELSSDSGGAIAFSTSITGAIRLTLTIETELQSNEI
jgi:hypothetical protein